MVNATSTVAAVMGEASQVVSAFAGLILLAASLAIGLFVVLWIVALAKTWKRG